MKKLSYVVVFLFSAIAANAQNVGIGTTSPNTTAKVDISSTTQGFLPPRMTYAQRNAIVSPAQGLIVYCTDCGINGQPQYYNGAAWRTMDGGAPTNPVSVTVSICSQVWLTKNLSVSKYKNGDSIPQVRDSTAWASATTGAWCWYKNDSATYAATYGKLYNWYAVTDPRGLAPTGYHLPTDSEWNVLVRCLDSGADTSIIGTQSTTAGGALKEAGTANWQSPNTGATNSSGFTALPGGLSSGTSVFSNSGVFGYFWTASSFDAVNAWFHRLNALDANAFRKNDKSKAAGFSVRCVKN